MPRIRNHNASNKSGEIDFHSPPPSKRRENTHSLKTSEARPFPLLELPLEVLNILLSYLVHIPWHPRNATYPDEAIKNLFPANVLQTNRFLRQRALEFIARKCLWIRVDFLSRPVWKAFDELESIPNLPTVYQDALPLVSPGIKFTLGEPGISRRKTRSFGTDTNFFLFPFNYQSFAALSGKILDIGHKIHSVKIELFNIPGYMRRIVDVQILPIVQLLRPYSHVSVLEPTGQVEVFDRDTSLIDHVATHAQTLMSMVIALDVENCVLEASILCMYHAFILVWMASETIDLADILNENSTGLAAHDWLVDPRNLERMRLVRTLFYFEYRALYTYIAGVDEFGYPFSKHHYSDIARISWGSVLNYRWIDTRTDFWLGLPDHETIRIRHMKALALIHNADFLEQLQRKDPECLLLRELWGYRSDDVYGAYYALLAWHMNTGEIEYAVTLDGLVRREPGLLQQLQNFITSEQHIVLWDIRDDSQPVHSTGTPNFSFRARKLAWSVDVAYESTKETDLPPVPNGGHDLSMINRLLGSSDSEDSECDVSDDETDASSYTKACFRTNLRWDRFGLNLEGVRDSRHGYGYTCILHWRDWASMW